MKKLLTFFKSRLGFTILVSILVISLASGSTILTDNLIKGATSQTISKEVSGRIQIVTVSGGGTGTTEPPDPESLTITKLTDFLEILNSATEPLSGDIEIQNNTTADLDLINAVGGPTESEIGTMEIEAIDGKDVKYPLKYKVKVGETQTITVKYIPNTSGKMPIGEYGYSFEIYYEY